LRNRQVKWIEVAPTQQIRENGENRDKTVGANVE
jgi:hypothetical protein